MKMPLTLNPKYWFGEKVMFDCRGRKGLGEIEAISLSQHNEVSYEILVVDEPYDIQGTVFENEIVSTESKKKIPTRLRFDPVFPSVNVFLFSDPKKDLLVACMV
ncbi:MAG: hypothetical protein K2Q30_15335 [Gemmataceae bacterium]|nr:hypothetical protein [Gemmataceae bacterium]